MKRILTIKNGERVDNVFAQGDEAGQLIKNGEVFYEKQRPFVLAIVHSDPDDPYTVLNDIFYREDFNWPTNWNGTTAPGGSLTLSTGHTVPYTFTRWAFDGPAASPGQLHLNFGWNPFPPWFRAVRGEDTPAPLELFVTDLYSSSGNWFTSASINWLHGQVRSFPPAQGGPRWHPNGWHIATDW